MIVSSHGPVARLGPSRATQTPPALTSRVTLDQSDAAVVSTTRTGSGIGAREKTRRWPSRMSSVSRSTTSAADGAEIVAADGLQLALGLEQQVGRAPALISSSGCASSASTTSGPLKPMMRHAQALAHVKAARADPPRAAVIVLADITQQDIGREQRFFERGRAG